MSTEIAAHSMAVSLPVEIALDLMASRINQVSGPARLVAVDPVHMWAGRLRLPGIVGQAPSSRFMRIMHLFPKAEQADDPALFEQLANGGRIGILISGQLAPIVARIRQQSSDEQTPILHGIARKHGLRLIEECGIGGPRSIVWAAFARAAEQAARPDLQDRFEFRYRRALAPTPGTQASLLTVLVLERP